MTQDKGRDVSTFQKNILMAKNFIDNFNLDDINNKHIIYISSDAVYSLNSENIDDKTIPSPTDLYSSMHLTREIMFKSKFDKNLTILRPTLVYGFGDTHNSYGPNRFFKQMFDEKNIKIFGEGSDLRDHLYIDDLSDLIYNFSSNHIYGTFNLASGNSISYLKLANLFKKIFAKHLNEIIKIKVSNTPTKRYFNIEKIQTLFDFKPTNLEDTLVKYFREITS